MQSILYSARIHENYELINNFLGDVIMNRPGSQEIKCTVKSCRYHDKDKHCTLADIVVGENVANASEKCETDCMSFEAL